MLILEKPFSNEEFTFASTLEDIKTKKGTLIFEYCNSSLDLYNFCKINDIEYGVIIKNKKELIFISNLGAKYAFCDTITKAKEFQKIAEDYLLDTKIIYYGKWKDLEKAIEFRIDGFKEKK